MESKNHMYNYYENNWMPGETGIYEKELKEICILTSDPKSGILKE